MSAALQQLYGGNETLLSPWIIVDQAMIDRFADATLDRQYIHTDPVSAAASPFGGTIAHGFLTLSLLPYLRSLTPELHVDAKMGVNIGCDRIRYLNPVRSGSRVRAQWKPDSLEEKTLGTFQCRDDVTIEIEGEQKPAMVAIWITRLIF